MSTTKQRLMDKYIGSQQHWEDSINDDYDEREHQQKEQIDNRIQPNEIEEIMNTATQYLKENGIMSIDVILIINNEVVDYSLPDLLQDYANDQNNVCNCSPPQRNDFNELCKCGGRILHAYSRERLVAQISRLNHKIKKLKTALDVKNLQNKK